MSVGVDVWDSDHKELLTEIKVLQDIVKQKVSGETVDAVLDDLNRYMETHLSSEEAVMKSMDYPGYKDHKAKHDEFRGWIKQQNDLREKLPEDWDSEKAAEFLLNWWYSHILTVDMAYKGFFENRKAKSVAHLAKYKGVGGSDQ